MRTFRFRAWDTHEEVMNRVDYVDFVNGVIGMSNENVRDYEQPIHRVKLMQSTGTKDKNRLEIFEGDIVDLEGHVKAYRRVIKDSVDLYLFEELIGVNAKDYGEVIGNIYENPYEKNIEFDIPVSGITEALSDIENGRINTYKSFDELLKELEE